MEKCILIFRNADGCAAVLAQLQTRGDLEAVTTKGNDVEITAAGTSKGAALLTLARQLGIPRENILSFGDSGNDFSMALAGPFIAMGNATAEAKAVATAVTLPVDQDGLAVYLERWLDTLVVPLGE